MSLKSLLFIISFISLTAFIAVKSSTSAPMLVQDESISGEDNPHDISGDSGDQLDSLRVDTDIQDHSGEALGLNAVELHERYEEALREIERLKKENETLKEKIHALQPDESNDTMSAREWLEKGLEYSQEGKYPEEINAYREALKIDPDYTDAHFNLALSYLIIGDMESAIQEYEILKKLDYERAEILYKNGIRRALSTTNIRKVAGVHSESISADSSFSINENYEKPVTTNIYTVQTGSFETLKRAKKQLKYIKGLLSPADADTLRIERTQNYYVVRVGAFSSFGKANKLMSRISKHIRRPIIIKTNGNPQIIEPTE